MGQIDVMINVPGASRETTIGALRVTAINITLIKGIAAVPHNCCRPQKKYVKYKYRKREKDSITCIVYSLCTLLIQNFLSLMDFQIECIESTTEGSREQYGRFQSRAFKARSRDLGRKYFKTKIIRSTCGSYSCEAVSYHFSRVRIVIFFQRLWINWNFFNNIVNSLAGMNCCEY